MIVGTLDARQTATMDEANVVVIELRTDALEQDRSDFQEFASFDALAFADGMAEKLKLVEAVRDGRELANRGYVSESDQARGSARESRRWIQRIAAAVDLQAFRGKQAAVDLMGRLPPMPDDPESESRHVEVIRQTLTLLRARPDLPVLGVTAVDLVDGDAALAKLDANFSEAIQERSRRSRGTIDVHALLEELKHDMEELARVRNLVELRSGRPLAAFDLAMIRAAAAGRRAVASEEPAEAPPASRDGSAGSDGSDGSDGGDTGM